MDRITPWTVTALLLVPSAALALAGSECPEPDRHERVVFNHCWKHREQFSLYRVSVTLRSDQENPEVSDRAQVAAGVDAIPLKDRAELLTESGLTSPNELSDWSVSRIRSGRRPGGGARRGVSRPEETAGAGCWPALP